MESVRGLDQPVLIWKSWEPQWAGWREETSEEAGTTVPVEGNGLPKCLEGEPARLDEEHGGEGGRA